MQDTTYFFCGGGDHSRGPLFLFPPSARPCLMYIVYLPDTCTPASFGFSSESTEISASCFFCRWKPSTDRWHCRTIAWTTPSIAPDTNCSSSRSHDSRPLSHAPPSYFSLRRRSVWTSAAGGRSKQAQVEESYERALLTHTVPISSRARSERCSGGAQ